MRKIVCDFCAKDISDYYMDDDDAIEDYSGKIIDLCYECRDKYFDIRHECGKKYQELIEKRDAEIKKEMNKFMNKKMKEAGYKKENVRASDKDIRGE